MTLSSPTPLTSVILPVYNGSDRLPDAIKSVLSQTYSCLELIIVDDGSTDDIATILAGISDPRIRVIHHPRNYGVARAYNTGILASRGEFIGFIGCDDLWEPDFLQESTDTFRELPDEFGVVYCDMTAVDPDHGRYPWYSPEITGPDLSGGKNGDYQVSWLGNGQTIIKRSCFDKTGLFDEKFRCHVDLELFLRLIRHYRFFHIHKTLYTYRRHKGICSDEYETSISRLMLIRKYPEIGKDHAFLSRQCEIIIESIGRARNQKGYSRNRGILDASLGRIDEKIVHRVLPEGTRRYRIYHRLLDQIRSLVLRQNDD